MPLVVKEIKNFWGREQFIRFPETLYRELPAYCIPLYSEQRKFISKDHPFRAHGDAALFMVFDGARPLARAMVSFDHTHKQIGSKVAYVGLFESINDFKASRAVLRACTKWAKEKYQVDSLRGPVDYSLNYPIGMYLGPYDSPQRILMNFNPPYYPELWEDFGFRKGIDFFCWWGKSPVQLDKWIAKVRRITDQSDVKIRCLTKEGFVRDLMRAKEFIGLVLEGNPGYVAMTELEHKHFVKDLNLVPPDLIMIAEDKNNRIVGISLVLPDFNEAIRPRKGKLFPFFLPYGAVKLFRDIKKIKTARVGLLGVHPDFRFMGIPERMVMETLLLGREKFKFDAVEIGWTFEDNVAMINNIEKTGADLKKSYRVYQLEI